LQDRVIEVHPEVSFWALVGHQPLAFSKRTPDGFAERRDRLAARLNTPIWSREDARRVAPPAAADDMLDAIVAAWTAWRYAAGEAQRLPPDPPIDARGRRMEIVY
jgi:predicted RNase H-like nuclease